MAAAIITGCILIGGTGTAYAKNVGGIQRMVQIWIHGDQTDAVMEVSEDGTYQMTYQDENGQEQKIEGGGIAMEANGQERPLTADELLAEQNSPEVEYLNDGSVWVYYRNQKIDITDKFDDRGICFVQVKDEKGPLYMTIKYKDGWCVNADKYSNPAETWDDMEE